MSLFLIGSFFVKKSEDEEKTPAKSYVVRMQINLGFKMSKTLLFRGGEGVGELYCGEASTK